VAFLGTLPKFDHKINAVYSEELEYTAALKKFRDENSSSPIENTFPLLVFKRGVLRHTDVGISRRTVTKNVVNPDMAAKKFDTFKAVFGEFDIDFLLLSDNMDDLENFEISYLSEAGQKNDKGFSYEIPGLGSFDHYVHYNLLDDKSIEIEQNHWKGLYGSATIRGFYFVATGEAKMITEIRASIRDQISQQMYSNIIITP
jgi:hypothetical protein